MNEGFCVKHYAGDVIYHAGTYAAGAEGVTWLDKNNYALASDQQRCLSQSTLPIMATRTSRASHASAAGALSGLSGAWSTSSSSAPPPKRLLRDRSRADGTDTVDASLTTDSVLSVRARTILASRCGLADGGVARFFRARAARPRRDSKGDGLAEFPTRTPPPTTRKVVAAMLFNRSAVLSEKLPEAGLA